MIGKYFKIGAAGLGLAGVATLVIFFLRLQGQVNSRNDEIQVLEKEIEYQAYQTSIDKAKDDTLKGIGSYSEPDTVWPDAEIIYRDSLRVDTLRSYMPLPKISGFVEIDTSKAFGADSFRVRVYAKLHYPEEFAYKNRLLFYPVSGKPPEKPVAKRSLPNWGIGLACAISLDGRGNLGLYGRNGRASLTLFWTPETSRWMVGANYEIARW